MVPRGTCTETSMSARWVPNVFPSLLASMMNWSAGKRGGSAGGRAGAGAFKVRLEGWKPRVVNVLTQNRETKLQKKFGRRRSKFLNTDHAEAQSEATEKRHCLFPACSSSAISVTKKSVGSLNPMSSTLSTQSLTAHSAQVQMHLELDGARVRIAQLGPDFVILAEAVAIQMHRGDLVFQVDAKECRWPVDLPHGLAGPGERTPIVNRG